jgi:hypothetical protein
MRLPHVHAPRTPPPREEEADTGRDALFEEMFPASLLPTFAPIASRRPRLSDTHGLRTRRERAPHGH